jgi:bifunctional UDP-N-acetylglucosamine pyrophosphorylase/glucosamine-1-phosphate N-acetyltransferase
MMTAPMPLSIVILAAGQGKRMKSALPKVLQPLAGRPLLKHVVDCARSLDAAAVHVVYGHGGAAVTAALRNEPVNWVRQPQQLGTGHALMQALPAIPDDHLVLVLYGDVPLVRRDTLKQLLAQAQGQDSRGSVSVLSVVLDDPTGYGRVVRDAAGKVLKIVEQQDASAEQLRLQEINTGLMALPARPLRRWLGRLHNDNAQREYYLTDIIAAAVAEKFQVNAVISPTVAEVLGINDKIQLAEVEAAHRRQKAQALMLAGVTVVDPARLDVRGEVSTGEDVVIDVNVVLVGAVKLGNRVKIGPNCYLRDTEIGDDTELFPNCVIDGAVIGPNCRVGPFARLRPGVELARDVHIGNFVEVKNSRIGAGSKANHLTYLGDTVIGKKANIGAGTVTCNYDGANKWQTEIGDGVFVGSGTMLVAPVQVGANATIGAGSTITHPAPAGKLTLERSRQVTVEHWQRPQKDPKKPET